LINLIGDAIKFTQQGEIVLTIGLDRTDSFEKGRKSGFRMLRISIRDTGIGIPDDKKDLIFDSFSQADTSTTRHYGGTGLGLAIAKAFVEKMGGRIWVESEYGKGSEFIFLLRLKQVKPVTGISIGPAALASPNDKKAVIIEELEFKGINMLIVEDNKINIMVINELLTKFGAFTDQAMNGREAVEKIKNNLYDVVLMDVHMPVMNGLEATRFVRKEISTDIPIIALTASAMQEDRKNALAAGMSDFIKKPIDIQHLKNVLRKFYSK
jgi:CheY-like chemotaxis protein